VVAYKDIADLAIEELLSSEDAPVLVSPQTSVADVILGLTERGHNVALVETGDNDFKAVSLEHLNEAVASVGGDGSKTVVGSVIGGGARTDVSRVSANVSVAGLAERSGYAGETLLITTPDGEPQAVIDRHRLADRVRRLVS
jgi:CBS domain-containing protein